MDPSYIWRECFVARRRAEELGTALVGLKDAVESGDGEAVESALKGAKKALASVEAHFPSKKETDT